MLHRMGMNKYYYPWPYLETRSESHVGPIFKRNELESGKAASYQEPEAASRPTPAACSDSILNDVKQFSPHEQHDDITLMIARCEEH